MCGSCRHREEGETAEGKTAKETSGNEPQLSYAGAQQPVVPNDAAAPQTLPVPMTMQKTNGEGEDKLTILGIHDHGQALVMKLGKAWPSAFTWGTVDGKGCFGWLQPETSRIRNGALGQMKADPRVHLWIEDKCKLDRERAEREAHERAERKRNEIQARDREREARGRERAARQDWGDHHSNGSGGGGSGGGWGD